MPAIFATIAITCGMAATTYCETFRFPQNVGPATLNVGLWSYRTKDWIEVDEGTFWVYTTCKSYGALEDNSDFEYDIDSKTRTAMAFAIIAPIIGGITLFWAWIAPCSNRHQTSWYLFSGIFLLTSIFQALSLMMIGSSICNDNPVLQLLDEEFPLIRSTFDDECEIGPGYRLAITAVVFWAAAGSFPFCVSPPSLLEDTPPQAQTVTYQKDNEGTVEEQNVTVVKGKNVPEQPVDPESK